MWISACGLGITYPQVVHRFSTSETPAFRNGPVPYHLERTAYERVKKVTGLFSIYEWAKILPGFTNAIYKQMCYNGLMTRAKKYQKHEIINGEKVCGSCLKILPVDQFTRDKRNATGLNYECKACFANRYSRDAYYIRQYGITQMEYDEMLKAQEGVCKICKQPPGPGNTKGGKLYVDHCHNSNKVRGLLCQPCNLVIGCAKDDVSILQSAIHYLNDNQ